MDPLAEEEKEKGNECMKKNNPIEAMLHYTQALKIDQENPTYYSNRSAAFLKMEQYYFALVDAEETIRRMPRWTKGYFRKAEVQMATEHFEEAILSYKKALETSPEDKSLNDGLAKARMSFRNQQTKERRLPWFGALFGFITSLLLIAADETIAKNQPIFDSDIAKIIVIAAVTAISAGFGYFYKMFLASQRCSLFEPPPDFFADQDPEEKKRS